MINSVQFLGARGMATITDSPLDKKVEMTHWEKVRAILGPSK